MRSQHLKVRGEAHQTLHHIGQHKPLAYLSFSQGSVLKGTGFSPYKKHEFRGGFSP